MKNSLSKKLFFAAAFFASVSLFGAEEVSKEKAYDQGHGVCEYEILAAYNAPARFDVKGTWDLFTTLSFLYWQPREDGLSLALSSYAEPQENPGKLFNMHFDYKPGFKIGVGSNFTHDNWNLFFEYTRLHGATKELLSKFLL